MKQRHAPQANIQYFTVTFSSVMGIEPMTWSVLRKHPTTAGSSRLTERESSVAWKVGEVSGSKTRDFKAHREIEGGGVDGYGHYFLFSDNVLLFSPDYPPNLNSRSSWVLELQACTTSPLYTLGFLVVIVVTF